MTKHSAQALGNRARGFGRLFADRKISTKIGMGFACMLVITAVIAASAYISFITVSESFATYAKELEGAEHASEMDRSFVAMRAAAHEYSLTGEAAYLEEVSHARDELLQALTATAAALDSAEHKRKTDQLSKDLTEFNNAFSKVSALRQEQSKMRSEVLDPFGEKLRVDFEELQAAAAQAGNSNVAVLAGQGAMLAMQMRLNVNKLLNAHEQSAAAAADKASADMQTVLKGIGGVIGGGRLGELYQEMQQLAGGYNDAYKKSAADAHEIESLINGEMKTTGQRIAADALAIKKAAIEEATALEHETESLIEGVEFFILALAIGGLIVGVVLSWIIGQGISKPIVALVPQLEKLAGGDFNIELPGLGRRDEIGQISEAAEMVAEKMGATINSIRVSASEVTNASAEIATSTTDLSQRTEEQAASLEETAASMEEIASTVKKNAENARQANDFASSTQQVADRGGEVVAKAVEAMARIEESSGKISDIISVIDEIARQTNLLALNAAVEAARAGDAGRGFAVVASEVRSLAQRSSQAANDIKDLIGNSTVQVKEGVDLVNRAGSALDEIMESIKKVAEVVSDIANASVEQSAGVDQISKALAQMDEVTQQNSALVEENAATAKTLEHQAQSMDGQVSLFRLRSGRKQAEYAALAPVQDDRHEPVEEEPKQPARKPAARPAAAAPKRPVAAAPAKRQTNGSGGPVGRMQTALATAVAEDTDWQEF